ncbi:hypothetical protein SAMD00019534_088290 [Acytostelium subglobosum LB1]|uniref:hypothetical protein n=1 Tax=Acytostelium subglobosum LB1 TaxID=1410327 RepID=UPI000644DC06|nr:hypothetical protein SAMD00019534_088290 [Acytostelium subglobosum LB1]GAM25654.1 hypothetical protein SAMD00019534_088290 [Acytostelium subglobosum LB1]|eukprot:XP_012751640.1 hypothetical protein SAMD00019534_088290 [Acytostelium subglobosum LB1]
MSHIESTINNIINEINHINLIINNKQSDINAKVNNNEEKAFDDVSEVVGSITSCSSIDEFINVNKDTLFAQDVDNDHPVIVNDDQLMSMIVGHIQHTHQVPYDKTATMQLNPCCINIDVNRLNSIRKMIETSFKLIQTGQQCARNYDGRIVSLSNEQILFFMPETSKWTSIKGGALKSKFAGLSTSVAYARGCLYVFGEVEYGSAICSRYSLADRQCYDSNFDNTIDSGNCISVCYDGNKYIYLVGGHYEGGQLPRVDRYDIETHQYTRIGELPFGVCYSTVHYNRNNDTIIVVGGEKDGNDHDGALIFNVQTLATEVVNLKHFIRPDMSGYSCFDEKDGLYILTNNQFNRYNLTTKRTDHLAMCPVKPDNTPIIYDRSSTLYIYLIAGKGQNYLYSILDDKWTLINDNDPINSHSSFSTFLIYD